MPSSHPNIEVRNDTQRGRGRSLHATTSLAPGQTILTVDPFLVIATLSHLETVCAHCLRAGTPRACTRCRSAYYCDATCQRAAWRAVHGRECAALKRVVEEREKEGDHHGQLPTPVRLLMQVLLLEGTDKDKDKKGGAVRTISELQGHMPEPGSKERRDMEMMAMGACVYAGKGSGNATEQQDVVRAMEILCKIQTNAFNYADDDLGQTGVFLEPTLAMMNHSCVPNAMVQVVGGKAILRAEAPIKAGDEIEISYTDYTWPLSKRRAALKPYKFTCTCPRCKDDLSIYQACSLYLSQRKSLSELFSLVPETAELGRHPVALDKAKSSRVNSISETASSDIDSFPESQAGDEHLRLSALRTRVRACWALLDQGAWAAAPVPHVVTAAAIYFSQKGNFAYGLALACIVLIECDPYRYAAPFHPMRVRCLFMTAKLLANTAAETAMSMAEQDKTNSGLAKKGGGLEGKIRETLEEIDQVSLCQMLLLMIQKLAPQDTADKWHVAVGARAMLDDIKQLGGRENEYSLISAWTRNPEDEQARSFFRFAVGDPCRRLAELGKDVFRHEFK